MVAAYLEFAQRFYCGSDGAPTHEVEHVRDAVRLLLKLYGTLSVHEFGLRQLKTLREQLIAGGLVRKTINDRINRVVRLFAWAAEEELCKPEVYGALRALRALTHLAQLHRRQIFVSCGDVPEKDSIPHQ